MDLSKIIAISGYPGLFRIVGQMKNGIIVEGLSTGKRMPAYASHKISALEDISMYTYDDDIPLKVVIDNIAEKEGSQQGPDNKISSDELKAWFREVLPEYDEDRVYVSDIKKLLKWYNELQATDNLIPEKSEEEESEASTEEAEDSTEKKVEAKQGEAPAETAEEEEGEENSEEEDSDSNS